MSIKSCEKIEKNTYELKLTADAAQLENAVSKAFAKTKKRYTVPGFRKGKATRSLIERMYGETVFYEDALEILYPELYEEAIAEAKIKPVDSPYDVNVEKIDKDGVEIELKVTVEPEVELSDYKGITAEKEDVKVTAAEVKAEIEKVIEQNARTITVEDRAAANGDTAVIDFEGFVDEVAFEGGKGENHSLEIGSNSFIPGFEEQLIGHKTGEEFDINVKFPKEYDEKLADKDAVFKIKLHEIKTKELPALDDDFVKDVSEFDTIEDYKKDVKENLIKQKEKAANDAFEAAVFDILCENTVVEIPEVMIDRAAEDNIRDFEYNLQMQGMSLEMYMQYLGMDMSALKEQYKEGAEKQVKLRLALMKIAEIEKMEASEDEKNEEIEKYAKAYGMDAEKIKKSIPVSDLENDIIYKKAMELVISNAKTKKPAAKKAAAKKTEEKKPAEKKTAEKKPATKKADLEKEKKETKTAKAPVKKAAEKPKADTKEKETKEKPVKAAEKKPAVKKAAAKKTTEKKEKDD
ncbi:MAG TPA: trigger factor [Oscillospiraceae bacterium]|nr:trigger factor [Oscillospiraceae bacterium]